MNTQELVALRIQQLCAEHGYNLHQLARSCGVPPSTLKNIIHGGSKNPGIVTIKLLCDGLGISLYEFFDTEDFREKEQEMKEDGTVVSGNQYRPLSYDVC